jgi:hypothetical protein
LRLALVVARKLKVTDLQKWIENELNGYTLAADNRRQSSCTSAKSGIHILLNN